jgi:rSAM/selenodomain-associated transferase 2
MLESTRDKVTVSAIIPVYNEKEKLIKIIDHVKKIKNHQLLEIIVVDGDGNGSTIKHLDNMEVITIKSNKGRAAQMNRGADIASGDVLLFLHADTIIPANAFEKITTVIQSGRYVGGAFDLGFDNQRWLFKLIAKAASIRSRITRIPFGDQAVFIKREYFNKIGGYQDIPLMEDVELMQRIKHRGDHIHIIPLTVNTSARKWEKEGVIYTTMRNWLLQFLYFCGVPPEKLVRYYYN